MIRQLAAASALVLALAACGGPGAGSATAASGTRTVATAHGPVRVPADPKRIVVLSGGQTDYLYALDAPVVATDTRVLGVVNDATGFPPAWSAEATRRGTSALPGGDELSVEAVAAQHPDLVIGGGQGITGVQAEQNYDRLSRIAPTVLIPSTVVTWQEELRLLADAVGRADRVPALMRAYTDRLAAVRASIAVPPGPVAVLLSLSNNQPCLVPADAALATLLRELGFVPDDVLGKAGNPHRYGTGDSFTVSAELLGQVANAPTAFVIPLGGRSAAQLAADPLYARLPAFRRHRVYELPAASFRPDYRGVLHTLDLIARTFPR